METNTARDLEQVVRMFVEMDVGPVSPSSTPRIRAIAFRNGTLDRNTVSGWHSRADISGNARHFCDGEFNFRIRGKAVRNGPLDRSDVKNVKRSADDSGKWTPFLLFRVQLLRIREKSFTVRRIWVWALLLVYSFIPVRQYFTLY